MELKVFVEPHREAMRTIIQKIDGHNIDIVEVEIPEDYIHIVVQSKPKQSPSKIMEAIKNISVHEFFRFFLGIKNKYFWGEHCGLKVTL